jgi:hypothetical protein
MLKARLTNVLRPWRWAWWVARPRRRPPGPAPGPYGPPPDRPHPPYYGDMSQIAGRDYDTKRERP